MNELVETLLYEGYALYPYTPGATKNATPTPFGIVYPPAYARTLESTHDHLDLQCVVEGEGDGEITAELYFLLPSGERHVAEERRIEGMGDFELGGVSVRTALSVSETGDGRQRVSYRVENHTQVPDGLERGEALRFSLISTHPVLRVTGGGRFVSQLDAPCDSVNTWPVLASDDDDVMLGAAIVLPDHPRIAPESRGNLFDNTEIEEALVLHVHALSDEERAEIEHQDPAVREMIDRAMNVTSDEVLKLHGRVELRDPVTREPPRPSADVRDPTRGRPSVEVDGTLFTRGGRVVVRPGLDADLQARMLEGRTVTVERIYRDYDGRVHLGVSVDEPGHEVMRDTGRFLWFFPPEVEVVE
ncbi:MAG: hypothetical protein QOI32_1997 [Thermoleophilaceae bacterium]|nr:hypothetical protein [Thermoleophilaceae bacterium]